MKQSLYLRLEGLEERCQELTALLAEADTIADQERFRLLGREYAEIEPVAQAFARYRKVLADIDAAQLLARDADPELRALAEEDLAASATLRDGLELDLQKLLLPRDPRDGSNVFLEIRAGTGGDEAAIFAGDLFRMYARYADRRGWRLETLSERPGEHGGFKEVVAHHFRQRRLLAAEVRIRCAPRAARSGDRVAGPHPHLRLHRGDPARGRRNRGHRDHAKADLRVDTYRSSGAGGQHVNKTDSAVRITHLPSGIVVECQDERSQHKNRARAMALLQALLLAERTAEAGRAQAGERKLQVGSGDRSERIRTYNYPQGRVTDHRINLTLYRLPEILEGDLDGVIDPLLGEYQAEQLAALAG
jgi:peptide chain release factor 1